MKNSVNVINQHLFSADIFQADTCISVSDEHVYMLVMVRQSKALSFFYYYTAVLQFSSFHHHIDSIQMSNALKKRKHRPEKPIVYFSD